MQVSRRGLLLGAAVGGGLVAAWALVPRTYDNPLEPEAGETAFDAWIRIARDGVVTVAVPQLEMGQGITTLIPQVVAMELGADWRQIAVEPAPVSGVYANAALAERWAPMWAPVLTDLADDEGSLLARRFAEDQRFTATAEGSWIAAYELSCREAAAAVRGVLCKAAAAQWDTDWQECRTEGGFVLWEDKRLPFGTLAEAAADFSAPDPVELRASDPLPPAPVPVAGEAVELEEPFPRLDLPSKVDGSFQFAADVRLPGMVYAAIKHGPLNEATLTAYDADAGAAMPGFVGAVAGKRWLAAVAETSWAAEQAVEAMAPRFSVARLVDSERMEAALDNAQRTGAAQRIATRGSGDEQMGTPDVALRYEIAPLLHGQIEPTSATAWLHDGRLELWLASQAPEQARRAAAAAAGVSLADTILYPVPAGGSFDRRLDHAHAIQAAAIARAIGRPVQLTWTRFQEHLAAPVAPPAHILLTAKLGEEGSLGRLRIRTAAPPSALEFGQRLFDNATSWAAIDAVAGKGDALLADGAMPHYTVPDVAVDHVPVKLPLPTGRLRGNAHIVNCFAIESFVDELARRFSREPLGYRMQMLGEDSRMAECLQRAARLAAWDGGAQGSGQGLACHRIGSAETGGRIAVVATAGPGEGGIRVQRIAAAVDIGRVVNRDIARQQIEGGLIFGIGLAVGSSTEYTAGIPDAQRLAALDLPSLADSPQITVEFIASDAEPADPGELGVAVAAPAIANALFSATGIRLRRLPLISGGL